ncbi:D-alanine--D-alanine ligase [Sarracenia purpurea var. burkii]
MSSLLSLIIQAPYHARVRNPGRYRTHGWPRSSLFIQAPISDIRHVFRNPGRYRMHGCPSSLRLSHSSSRLRYQAWFRNPGRYRTYGCPRNVAEKLRQIKPDLVFIALHGPYGEDGCIQGSSIGVHLIFSHEDYLRVKDDEECSIMDEMMIEEYIAGVDVQTAVLLDEAIGTIEIRPKKTFYDYQAKYTDGLAEHVFPAEIPDHVYEKTLQQALKVHRFLRCKAVSRSDFRYDPEKKVLKMLEINTHPGFTELSLMPEIAMLSRVSNLTNWSELLWKIVLQTGIARNDEWVVNVVDIIVDRLI